MRIPCKIFRHVLLAWTGFSLLFLATKVWSQEFVFPITSKIEVQTEQRGLPSALLTYDELDLVSPPASAQFLKAVTPVQFTGLAIGWSTGSSDLGADLFSFDVRTQKENGEWTEWVHLHGETAPFETPSGIYWSQLYVTPDGGRHLQYEIAVRAPEGVTMRSVRVSVADASAPSTFPSPPAILKFGEVQAGPLIIIPRKDWWGNLPPQYLNPTNYTPQPITVTHALVHHTAGENNPPNPPQVVRNIWDFHVNSNGWSDIGYNFLVDQFGTIYQGRYNPWLSSTDVRGAHAGEANNQSVGISLLGQFHPSASPPAASPDSRALRSLEQVIAWRFGQRSLNALSSANLETLWGTRFLPRISGHRDARSTACPGDNLYVLLSQIRNNVNSIVTFVEMVDTIVPQHLALNQNYPNPFNPETRIEYAINNEGFVRLTILDLLGRTIRTLVSEAQIPGCYAVAWDGRDQNGTQVTSGMYLYRLHSEGGVLIRKMTLLK